MKIRILCCILLVINFSLFGQTSIEKWKVFELTVKGPSEGNPFKDVKLSAKFFKGSDKLTVPGFYDGDGIYKVRFMHIKEGQWNYITTSNIKKLSNKKGSFD